VAVKKITAQVAASIEGDSFGLLRQMQRLLAGVLKSVEGKWGAGLFEHYLVHSSGYINRGADAFIALRETGRVDASKLLVRPAMEMMFRQQAVLEHPELLYRMAYTERLEDRRLILPVYTRAGKDYERLDQRQWNEFSGKYSKQYPKHAREDKKLKLSDIAKAANMDGYYNSYYRLYCQFTHGSFRAMVGGLKLSDSEDNPTVAACVLGALRALNIGVRVDVPELGVLQQRLFNLPGRTRK
jgi:hypothetical protein